jgi:hypothetical protein
MLGGACLAAGGCKRAAPASLAVSGHAASGSSEWFEDATSRRGIRFVHHSDANGRRYAMPEEFGSSAALFDFDNDGYLDALLLQNAGPGGARNVLLHREADGTFRDVSEGSGVDLGGYFMGVAIGDVNNDGLNDVLLTGYGGARLLLNRGGGRFQDITREAGLDAPGWSVSASFCDLDGDGWLDLVVVQYVAYSPSNRWTEVAGQPEYPAPQVFAGSSTRVYRNLGAAAGGGVRFEDVSFSSGVGRVPGPGLGVVCADFDGDGWPDILIANDGAPNRLWINQHDFTFREEGLRRGVGLSSSGVPQANMGIAIADLAGDGLLDVYITHLTEEINVLWKQDPAGFFEDRTAAWGLASPAWRGTGFGAVFADFENRGVADLAVVNGRVRRARLDAPAGGAAGTSQWEPYRERNQLFRNEGNGRFRDVSAANPAFCAVLNVGRGLTAGDIDNHGGIDLLVTAIDAPARLYRNVAPRGHWITVRAIDPSHGGRDSYGAHIIVRAGGSLRHGWVNPGYSFACSNDPRVHFGLGASLERIDGIEITWPDGPRETESFEGGAVDRIVTLARGSGRRSTATRPSAASRPSSSPSSSALR